MTLVSAHSPVIADGRRGRSAAAFALCAGAFALAASASVAGCGSSAAPMTPRTAIGLAADKIRSVTSMTATFSDQITGTVAETTSGTVKVQVKPLLAKVGATASADGQTFPIDEIMSAKTLYLSSSILSVFAGHTGKAWFEIPLANLSGNFGTSPTGLLQDVQNGNPLTQTEMLAAAKNVRSLGTQVINGVRTTHYAGSFTASAALGSLTPGLRKQIEAAGDGVGRHSVQCLDRRGARGATGHRGRDRQRRNRALDHQRHVRQPAGAPYAAACE
jgi:hypothetical protein